MQVCQLLDRRGLAATVQPALPACLVIQAADLSIKINQAFIKSYKGKAGSQWPGDHH